MEDTTWLDGFRHPLKRHPIHDFVLCPLCFPPSTHPCRDHVCPALHHSTPTRSKWPERPIADMHACQSLPRTPAQHQLLSTTMYITRPIGPPTSHEIERLVETKNGVCHRRENRLAGDIMFGPQCRRRRVWSELGGDNMRWRVHPCLSVFDNGFCGHHTTPSY